jgi:hypothetical protein
MERNESPAEQKKKKKTSQSKHQYQLYRKTEMENSPGEQATEANHYRHLGTAGILPKAGIVEKKRNQSMGTRLAGR